MAQITQEERTYKTKIEIGKSTNKSSSTHFYSSSAHNSSWDRLQQWALFCEEFQSWCTLGEDFCLSWGCEALEFSTCSFLSLSPHPSTVLSLPLASPSHPAIRVWQYRLASHWVWRQGERPHITFFWGKWFVWKGDDTLICYQYLSSHWVSAVATQ